MQASIFKYHSSIFSVVLGQISLQRQATRTSPRPGSRLQKATASRNTHIIRIGGGGCWKMMDENARCKHAKSFKLMQIWLLHWHIHACTLIYIMISKSPVPYISGLFSSKLAMVPRVWKFHEVPPPIDLHAPYHCIIFHDRLGLQRFRHMCGMVQYPWTIWDHILRGRHREECRKAISRGLRLSQRWGCGCCIFMRYVIFCYFLDEHPQFSVARSVHAPCTKMIPFWRVSDVTSRGFLTWSTEGHCCSFPDTLWRQDGRTLFSIFSGVIIVAPLLSKTFHRQSWRFLWVFFLLLQVTLPLMPSMTLGLVANG